MASARWDHDDTAGGIAFRTTTFERARGLACEANQHLLVRVLMPRNHRALDDDVLERATRAALADRPEHALGKAGVATAIHYPTPIHLQPAYAHLGQGPGSCPVAERSVKEMISLPMFPDLSEAQIDYVCAQLAVALR